MPRYSINQFTMTTDLNLVVEASTLDTFRIPNELQVAFENEVVEFFLARTDSDREGDVQAWVYHAIDCGTVTGRPTVTILND